MVSGGKAAATSGKIQGKDASMGFSSSSIAGDLTGSWFPKELGEEARLQWVKKFVGEKRAEQTVLGECCP